LINFFRANDIDTVLTWIINHDINGIGSVLTWIINHEMDVPDDTQEPFKKLASVPMPDGRTPEQRVKDVEGILIWVRYPKDKEGPETAPFKTIDQLISSEARANS
jgi:hypothetical protein